MAASFQGGAGSWQGGAVADAVQEPAQAQNPVLCRRLDEAVTAEKGGLVAFLPWDDPAQVHWFKRAPINVAPRHLPMMLCTYVVTVYSVPWWLRVYKYNNIN